MLLLATYLAMSVEMQLWLSLLQAVQLLLLASCLDYGTGDRSTTCLAFTE
jgi:hypothetical protein